MATLLCHKVITSQITNNLANMIKKTTQETAELKSSLCSLSATTNCCTSFMNLIQRFAKTYGKY